MKRLWIFPLLFFILLLSAFQLRWYEGPLHKDGDYWVLYRTDRWSGHTWFYRAHLAENSGPQISADQDINPQSTGEREKNNEGRSETPQDTNLVSSGLNLANVPTPIFLDHFVPAVDELILKERVAKALETGEIKQSILEIQYKLEDTARIIQANREGHLSYVKAEENYRLRRTRRMPTAEQEEAHKAWSEANDSYLSLNKELSEIYYQVRINNAQIIREQVILETKVFTVAWMLLTFLCLLLTVHYFVSEVKQAKRINETFEVIEYHTRKDKGRGDGSSFNITI